MNHRQQQVCGAPSPNADAATKRVSQDGIPEYVVQLPQRGGRGVLAGDGIISAAHCIAFSAPSEMVLGDYFIEQIQIGETRLHVTPVVVEPVSDIALLGALDPQAAPVQCKAFEDHCLAVRPVPLFRGRVIPGHSLPVLILGLEGEWIKGTVERFDMASPRLWLEAEAEIPGGCSGGPIVTCKGELVAVVSNSSVPNGDIPSTGICVLPLVALPGWACRKYLAPKHPAHGVAEIIITTNDPEAWPKPKSGSRLRGIFDMLVKHMGEEVEMSSLSAYSDSLTIHTQVARLRDEYQLVIANRCKRYNDGIQAYCRSYYRLAGRAVPRHESI